MTDEKLLSLLPWYINNTLEATEREQVDELLSRSELARQQLDHWQHIANHSQQEQPISAPADLGWRRLKRDIQQNKKTVKHIGWKQGFAAAAMLIIALQVSIINTDPTPNAIELLNDTSMDLQQGWLFQAQFKDQASWFEINAHLQEINGQIISGPTSFGIVRIYINNDNQQFDSKAAALTWLKTLSSTEHAAIEPGH